MLLDKRSIEVEVAALRAGGDLLSNAMVRAGVPVWRPTHPMVTPWASVLSLRSIVRSHAIDIVHSHLPQAGLATRVALRLPGTRAIDIYTEHNVPAGYRPLGRALNRVSAGLSSTIACVSAQVRKEWIAYGSRAHSRAVVIPNGIQAAQRTLADEERAALRSRIQVGTADFVVTCVANLHQRKGHRTLLRAIADCGRDDITAVLVGDGPEREALESEAGRLGIGNRVRFLGHRRDVQEILAASDAFALTSSAEGLPMALLEAMAQGLSCLVTNAGGMSEVVNDDVNGLVIAKGDSIGAARALRALASSPELRHRLGRAAKMTILDRHGADQMTRSYETLYRAVFDAHGASDLTRVDRL